PSVRSSASLRTLRVFPPPPPPAFYTLSLHDALPIWESVRFASERSRVRIPPGPPNKKNPNPFLYGNRFGFFFVRVYAPDGVFRRSEEHTSELQSRFDLVCRLLLEKKKHTTAVALTEQ